MSFTTPSMRPNSARVTDDIKKKLELCKFYVSQFKLRINAQFKTADNVEKKKNKTILESLSDTSNVTYPRPKLVYHNNPSPKVAPQQKQLDAVDLTYVVNLTYGRREQLKVLEYSRRQQQRIKNEADHKQQLNARR